MNEQRYDDIDAILDQIYSPNDTDTEQDDQSQPRRIINVYIDVEEQEIATTVESTLDTQPATVGHDATEPQHSEPLPVQPIRHPRTKQKRSLLLVIPLVALLGLAIGFTSGVILPVLTPSATVTLVTRALQQTTTSTIHVINGAADPTRQQLTGRGLASVTMSQQKTVLTTGIAHQDAKAGHGIITFYNAATYTQTIPVGTVLIGADGMQIVTDADAMIPAAVFPTFGQRSIPAHAATTGPAGNIRAGDVYGSCCRLNVSAVNGAFTDGQNARTYQTVTVQDINDATASMKTSLEQSAQAALQTQVQPTETLITPLPCTQKVTPDHQPGEETIQVRITIDETCTGTTYNTQAFTSLTAQIATQDATRRLGTGYTTIDIQTSITQATTKEHGSIDLQVKSVSMWVYQYGAEQQQAIKAMIVGMNKEKAKATLLHMAGVQSVSLMTTNTTILPTDTEYIHLLFVQV